MDIFQVPKIITPGRNGLEDNAIVIFIEGNIASRKTTTLMKIESEKKAFKERGIKLQFLYELEPSAEIMGNFYNGEQSKAIQIELLFQRLKIHQLHTARMKCQQSNEKRAELGLEPYLHIILADRGVLGNYAFTMNNFIRGNISFEDRLILDKQFFTNREFYSPDYIVYLRTPAEQCLNDCRNRRKESEKNIQLDYLRGLERMHDIILRVDMDPEVDGAVRPMVIEKFDSDKYDIAVRTFKDDIAGTIFRTLTFSSPQFLTQNKNGYIDIDGDNENDSDNSDSHPVSTNVVRGIGYDIDPTRVFELNFDMEDGMYKPKFIRILENIIGQYM